MYKELEYEIKFHMKLCDDARIVVDEIELPVRTVIIHEPRSNCWWLFQSSWSQDEGETDVSMIRLSNKILTKLELGELLTRGKK